MRIAVISDTHLDQPTPWFEEMYERHLAQADWLLHCGDVTGRGLLEYVERHPGFYGVAGNMDGRPVDGELPPTRVVELDGLRVGMAHGYGYGHPIARTLARAFAGRADLVCFGHTHRFEWVEHEGVRVLNPGSFCVPKQGDRPGFALVERLGEGELAVEHVALSR
jgi:hypothetical protein